MSRDIKIKEQTKGSISTKDQILNAAEVIFAKDGYKGASMRQILSLANVNVAAGHYHFGSKENLFHAVVSRYLAPLNEERLARLDAVAVEEYSHDNKYDMLASLIRAYIAPHIRLSASKKGKNYGRLLAYFLIENEDITRPIFMEHVYPMRAAFRFPIKKHWPELTDDKLELCFNLIALTMTGSARRISTNELNTEEMNAVISDLTHFLTNGVMALFEQT